MITYFWFTPTKAGTYEAMCAELCGTGHYTMRGSVVVEEEAAYQEWLKKQPTFKQVADRAAKQRGPNQIWPWERRCRLSRNEEPRPHAIARGQSRRGVFR